MTTPNPWLPSEADGVGYLIAEQIATGLAEKGYALVDHFLTQEEVSFFVNHIESLEEEGSLRQAGIGKQLHHQVDKSIRKDFIKWISESEALPETTAFLSKINALKDYLNRTCFLGIKGFECHFAKYPEGAFYKKHVDRFKQNAHRVISVVCYLNPNWQPQDGGELGLYLPDESLEIAPMGGRLICFKSELLHEVKLAHTPRYSITGWMLDQEPTLTFL